jgi:hypothetical protein
VVDDDIGAQFLGQGELGRRPRGGDDGPGALLPGQLHGEMADRARARGDQDDVALAEPPGAQRSEGHGPGCRQHGRGRGAEPGGYRREPGRVGDHVVGAGVLEQDGHPGSGHGRVGARPGLLHGAHHIPGQRAGQRAEPDGVGSGLATDLDVDVVDADRLGADQHLPGAGLRGAGLLDRQHLGASVGVIAHVSHRSSPPLKWTVSQLRPTLLDRWSTCLLDM